MDQALHLLESELDRAIGTLHHKAQALEVQIGEFGPVRLEKPEAFRFFRRLANYEFGAKAMVEGYLAGRHRSKQRGSSIEFHEYRQYVPGDDPSQVDWRVFARNDKLFLRTFEQETNLECHVFLDCSASMGFPEKEDRISKLEYASFFAACLAYLVISKNDRVSLALFDEGIRKFLPPGSTRKHLLELLGALETCAPGSGTSITDALKRANPLLKRKGTLVILSDFFTDTEELSEALQHLRYRKHDISLFHLMDPQEIGFNFDRPQRFVDLEDGTAIVAEPNLIADEYQSALKDFLKNVRKKANDASADYQLVTTDTPLEPLLREFLTARLPNAKH
jgi:uncharacterized protein (DUF58 family)